MNLLKKFVRNDPADFENDEIQDDIYIMPADIEKEMNVAEQSAVSAIDDPARKTPDIRPAGNEKVELKLLRPKSHTESVKIADKLKEGCIVLLDISNLEKEQAIRLVDFVAGVAYVLGGEMIKTNRHTIVVSPSGVDISGFASDPAPAEEEYEEVEVSEDGAYEEYEETVSE
jgi:cell division inhibitor SepF